MKKLFVISLLILGFIRASFSSSFTIDSLIINDEYENILAILDDQNLPDTLYQYYKLISYYNLNTKRYKQLCEKIRDEGNPVLYYQIQACENLENNQIESAQNDIKEIEQRAPLDAWALFLQWEIDVLGKEQLKKLTSGQITSFPPSEIRSMDSLMLAIYYYSLPQPDSALNYFRILSHENSDTYKFHFYAYLLADERKDYFEKDFEFQKIWRLRTNKQYQFNNYLKRFILFSIQRYNNNHSGV